MADTKGKVTVELQGTESVQHLDRDPNDPRRVPQAKANLSNLNEEDPEKESEFQNPVK